ncbi:MAG TPA: OmpA family protein [Phenylobacterium sp.]|uniref:OmpA family protein n=1 Tax=Phenylobacterium sp. TaxID=1871053 RepID=UPI002B49402F|nr:OmpA family protein [Phenylobacterium sp.]HKR89565.1 OmpA family protein [Phenylobacterium sp.]
MRSFTVAALAATAALGGCSTMGDSRVVRAPNRCADQTVQVYFEAWSSDLTPEGASVIKAAAQSVQGCQISAVDVLGLADAVGAPGANLELSQKRAQSVSKALEAAGLPAADMHLTAAGAAGAVTASGKTKPLRRRVDVTLHVAG